MSSYVAPDAWGIALVSALVGIVVGLTGMGGGALMTPALIFLGVNPTAAVANDLVAAAVNKSVGASVHWRQGSPDLRLVVCLVCGSVPTAFAGAFIVRAVGSSTSQEAFVRVAIGGALVLTALIFTLRSYVEMRGVARGASSHAISSRATVRRNATIAVGAAGGMLVGLTSVGSGSLIMVGLLLLYPGLQAARMVGTDLVQAVPLVVAAAASHALVTGVHWEILIPLIAGGTPGTFLGARLAHHVPQSVVKRGIAIVLTLTGLTLLNLPATFVGIAGAALLLLGPLLWGVLRYSQGLPAFEPSDTRTANLRRLVPDRPAAGRSGSATVPGGSVKRGQYDDDAR